METFFGKHSITCLAAVFAFIRKFSSFVLNIKITYGCKENALAFSTTQLPTLRRTLLRVLPRVARRGINFLGSPITYYPLPRTCIELP
jgi:hypothetical protein